MNRKAVRSNEVNEMNEVNEQQMSKTCLRHVEDKDVTGRVHRPSSARTCLLACSAASIAKKEDAPQGSSQPRGIRDGCAVARQRLNKSWRGSGEALRGLKHSESFTDLYTS